MKQPAILWIAAFAITLATGVVQRMTGPSYPISGTGRLDGSPVHFRFERAHGGRTDHPVTLVVEDPSVSGVLLWRRHRTADEWTRQPMTREGPVLKGSLPAQPAAGKLQYRVELTGAQGTSVIPDGDPVIIRFRGDVPTPILVLHIVAIFAAMLLSARTGLEFFASPPRTTRLIWWTLGLLFGGGLILGPIVQKYAFDAYWTGWPFGTDLTDNKTLVAFLGWCVAGFMILRRRKSAGWALGAALVTLVVFLIPHSLLGSEYDYGAERSDRPAQTQHTPPAQRTLPS